MRRGATVSMGAAVASPVALAQYAAKIDSNRLQRAIDNRRAQLPIPAKEFGANALADAIMLTGTIHPTAAQLDAILYEMYPVGGPTAASLIAAGWLLPTTDRKGLRRRELPTVTLSI